MDKKRRWYRSSNGERCHNYQCTFFVIRFFFTLSEAHKNNIQLFGEYKKIKDAEIQNYQILEKDYGEQAREMVEDMTEEEFDTYLNENSELCQEDRNAESIDKKLSEFEKERRKKEKAYQKCSSIILIVALFELLVITTLRIHFSEKQTNIFTVAAFFLVIFNLYIGIQYKEKLDLLYQELEDCNKDSIKK